ncbi:unnamed protein product [Urochloa decumbens]|uniref:RING-type domain-containing protein n=1 Tax=Urochloa decumbens TaxID=240449 RepID=A0ABC9H5I9_9POAL
MSSPVRGRRRSRDSMQQMDAAQAPPATSDGRVVAHRPVAVDGRQYDILWETRIQPPYEDAERHSRVVGAFVIFEIESQLSQDSQHRRCKRARVAASSDAVLGLQEARAGDAAAGRTPAECAVCLQDFVAEDTLRAMPCSHTFHQDCIFRWLRVNHVCPLCRHALPTQQQDDDDLNHLQDELDAYYHQMYDDESYDQNYGGEYYHQHYGDGN